MVQLCQLLEFACHVLDQGMDIFREHSVEFERVISELELLGPVVVTGDFNAHLGKLGGSRGAGDVNMQGVLLHKMMGRCNLRGSLHLMLSCS